MSLGYIDRYILGQAKFGLSNSGASRGWLKMLGYSSSKPTDLSSL